MQKAKQGTFAAGQISIFSESGNGFIRKDHGDQAKQDVPCREPLFFFDAADIHDPMQLEVTKELRNR